MTLLKLSCLAATLSVLTGCQTYCASHPGECTPPPTFSAVGPGSCSSQREMATPHEPLRPPPPITGGSLAAMDDGTWIIADTDRAVVWHVDGTHVLGRYPLRTDDQPGRVLARGTHAYIALRHAGQIADLDLEQGVLARFDTCTEPRAVVFRGDELLIGCAAGTIETSSRQVVLADAVVSDLRDLTVDGDRLLISTFRNAQVFEVRGASAPRVLNAPPKPLDARGRAFAPRVGWRLRGSLLVAQDELSSELQPFTPCSAYYGPPPGFETGIVGTAVYRVEGAAVHPLATVAAAVLPVDIAENDVALIIVSAGTNALVVIDPVTGTQNTWPLPGQPTSVAISGNTVAVFLREPASLLLFATDGASDSFADRFTLRANISMNAASVFSTGHDLFHRATPKNIACASCHPEAGEDGHVWQFAEGARRTPSLRGGLVGTAPFHWSGDEGTMGQLMRDVMDARMGGAGQTEGRTASLLTWLDTQLPLNAPPVNDASAARGRVLFDSSETGCASCHAGPKGTNNATVDVGTRGRFQVPRLTELAWRAPLFHDGSVASLDDRLLPPVGAEAHGHVAHLDAAARADLLEYLKTR